jgi:hypothetical protein
MVGAFGDRDAQCVAFAHSQKSSPSGVNDWRTRLAPKSLTQKALAVYHRL